MMAPSFARTGLNGRRVDLATFRNRVVLLDFWATWCAPCISETPRLITLQKRYGMRLQVIGVAMDDSAAPVKAFARRFAFNYPIVLGDAKFGELYGGVYGLPRRFLIGPNGKITAILEGELRPGALERSVQIILGHY